MQDDLGHEVGWHNDLVTLACVHDIDARSFVAEELARLRDGGLRIEGTASHASPWCAALGFHNQYFFEGLTADPGVSALRDGADSGCKRRIEKATLAEFGFAYEAYFLGEDDYVSDFTFQAGRRWHPDAFDPAAVGAGRTAIVLVHPCHGDRSARCKSGPRRSPGSRRAPGASSEACRVRGRDRGSTPPPLA